jgi:hypothetical protein
MKVQFTTIFLFFFTIAFSQTTDTVFNQRDLKGLRQGIWKNKWLETGKIANSCTRTILETDFVIYWENRICSLGCLVAILDGEFRSYYKSEFI